MPRKGITKDQVYATADLIAAGGQNPTLERVRSNLATGSMATIHKYLQKWKLERLNPKLLQDLELRHQELELKLSELRLALTELATKVIPNPK